MDNQLIHKYVQKAADCTYNEPNIYVSKQIELVKHRSISFMMKHEASKSQEYLLNIINTILKGDKLRDQISLDKFRRVLGQEYPYSFPYKQSGDAHSYD